MVATVTAVLKRLKTEWATQLQPEAIIAACEEAGYTSWRDRVLTPVTTICNGLQTAALGLANKGDFEPTLAANMRGCEPTLAANELTFIATSSQTAPRTHIYCIQNREGVAVREK
jgi:hypothetical protein